MLGLGNLYDLVVGVLPLDLQTAREGDFVSLKNAQWVDVLVIKGVGTDGDDQTLTFEQASAVAGTGVKNLAVIAEYWEKEALTDLTGTGTWTRVTQSASHAVALGDPSAQSAALYLFHIEADQLDADNGFDCVRVGNDGAGSNAQLGTILYILGGLRHKTAPERGLSYIVD